jgi:hypothetical protein
MRSLSASTPFQGLQDCPYPCRGPESNLFEELLHSIDSESNLFEELLHSIDSESNLFEELLHSIDSRFQLVEELLHSIDSVSCVYLCLALRSLAC